MRSNRNERARALALVGLLSGAAAAFAHEPATEPKTTPPAPFGWLADLAGACWLGTGPDGKPTDRQCYARQYAFLRGTLEIFAGSATGKAAFTGDSLFAWDEAQSEIDYDYWASAGHFGRARAHYEGERLVFPPTDEGEAGGPRLRSIWDRLDADSFRVTREGWKGDGWRETLRVVYRRDTGGPPELASGPPPPGGPLEAFAFLGDSCWMGTFADGRTKDEVCFEWVLGGRFLRSPHRVLDGEGPYEGESLYGFDPESGRPFFVYWSSQGGVVRGTATPVADGVDFPDEKVTMGGKSFTLRTTWRRQGADRYVSLTERERDGAWEPMMRIEFERTGPSPPSRRR